MAEKQGACAPCEGDSKAVALQRAAGLRNVAESQALRQDHEKGHTRVEFLRSFLSGEVKKLGGPCPLVDKSG